MQGNRPISKDTIRAILSSPTRTHWEKIGISHKDGVCVPLFSLKTRLSCGIGEFTDLIPLFLWCKKIGFHIVQLLPLNDTGEDTSPYNSISSVALNPIFLSLTSLPDIEKISSFRENLSFLRSLNDYDSVQYEAVRKIKIAILREYYEFVGKMCVKTDPLFQSFLEKEAYWLKPYALFRSLRESFQNSPINQWPGNAIEHLDIKFFEERHSDSVAFFQYLQYLCFQQFSLVRKEADKLGILIKGDIPILISNDSADVWYYRKLFTSSVSVGAPPDLYNQEGQNWKLPLYNWEAMEATHYEWWEARLRYAENFYSLYRLDHVAGFFRMWVIPKVGKARFIPAQESEFLVQGVHVLKKLLHFSKMLPVGEDLGDVPLSIRTSLKTLGICGTKIPRWERRWDFDGSFIPLAEYEPISLTSLSTHDSDTLLLWWLKNPLEAKSFAEMLGITYTERISLEAQEKILRASHHSASLLHINLLNDYLSLDPAMVSSSPEKERINIPGTISKTNWVYRCKPYLEDLLERDSFNKRISSILSEPLSK
ncbi:4-alpha-glucanotransferase [Chlamydiifrater phoenicopteri]|uniref:4-alpha-glucanotransferase n=1 Tax=Chlamydiifrater phoenicopteri TaxID=2681469 RepID=UPI001BCDD722|nr:4-alpha-glucanotransferase [Chlamydiifrater phoenicopteri]